MRVPDMLETIFERQAEFMARLGHDKGDYGDINDRDLQGELRACAGFLVEELYEAVNLLKLKPWKQTFVETDRVTFYDEIADAFHFFIEFCILAGIDAETLTSLYHGKQDVNIERQETGY